MDIEGLQDFMCFIYLLLNLSLYRVVEEVEVEFGCDLKLDL